MRDALDNIVARHISENLESCNVNDDASIIKKIMDQKRFDVYGVKDDDGLVIGYVKGAQLRKGKCKGYLIKFEPGSLISDGTSLFDILILMENRERLFVLQKNEVYGIITRGDLQKAPMRLMIFSVLSILEMYLQRELAKTYKDDSWQEFVAPKNLEKAQNLYNERRQADEDISIFECLYFKDKCAIVCKTSSIFDQISEQISNSQEKLCKMNKLRNNVVHPKNIARGSNWCDVINLVKNADILCQFFDKKESNL